MECGIFAQCKKKKVTNCYTLKQCNLYVGFSPLCLHDLRASWENSSHCLIMISLGLGGNLVQRPRGAACTLWASSSNEPPEGSVVIH